MDHDGKEITSIWVDDVQPPLTNVTFNDKWKLGCFTSLAKGMHIGQLRLNGWQQVFKRNIFLANIVSIQLTGIVFT